MSYTTHRQSQPDVDPPPGPRRGRRRWTAVAVIAAAAVIALIVGAFLSDGSRGRKVTPSAPPKPTASAPAPSAQPTMTAQDRATNQARAAIERYYDVKNRLGANPRGNTDALKTVAVSGGLKVALNDIARYRTRGYRQIGDLQVADITVREVDLRYAPKAKPPQIPTVVIDLCYDVSKVNVVDRAGKSVVIPTRKNRAIARVGVVNYSWPDANGWKVSYVGTKGDPCAAS